MRRRWVVGGLLTTLSILALPPATAAPTTAPTLTLTIDTLEPRVLTATGRLDLAGTITSTASVDQLHLALQTGTHVGSRGQLHALRTDGAITGLQLVGGLKEDVPGGRKVTSSRSARFHVQVDVSALHLAQDQVSPLRLSVTGADGASGHVDTFLPYFPVIPQAAPQIALVVPFTTDPDSASDPLTAEATTRLSTAVSAALEAKPDALHARRSAVSLAVDPAVLPHLAGTPLLASLQQAAGTTGVSVQALPVADADLDALQAAGDTRSIPQHLAAAQAALGPVLGSTSVGTDPLLPAGGVLTNGTLSSSGAHAVLLDGVLPADPDASVTPTALTTVGRATPALVTDPELQTMLTAADTGAATPRMAEQLLLAETALIAAEAPNAQPARAVVLLAPRHWGASVDWARHVVADLGAAPWLQPTAVASLLRGPRVARAGTLPATNPAALPGAGIREGDRLRQQASTVGSLLATGGAALAKTLEATIDRSESSAWRDSPSTAQQLRDAVHTATDSYLTGVVVDVGSRQYLTGSTGSIPVTITSTVRKDVVVVLTLTPPRGSRIEASSKTVSIAASGDGGTQRVQTSIPVKSSGAGRFPVTVTVGTRDGQTLGRPIPVTVRSGNLGTVALTITFTALGVLVLALIFRGTRGAMRMRRKRQSAGGRHRAPAGASA